MALVSVCLVLCMLTWTCSPVYLLSINQSISSGGASGGTLRPSFQLLLALSFSSSCTGSGGGGGGGGAVITVVSD